MDRETWVAGAHNLFHLRTPERICEIWGYLKKQAWKQKNPWELEKIVTLFFLVFEQPLSFDFLKRKEVFPLFFLHRLSLPVLANALGCSCGVSLSDRTAFVTLWQIFQHTDTSQCTPVSNAPFPQLVTFQVKNVPMSRKHRQKSLRWSSLLRASEIRSSQATHCNSNEGYHEEKKVKKTKQDQCKVIDPYFLLQRMALKEESRETLRRCDGWSYLAFHC